MANLDAPTLQPITALAGSEHLVTVKDGVERKLPVNGILGLGSAEVTLAAGEAAVVSKRLTVFSGRTAATVATIPAASGALRELIIINANTTSGALTITAPTASIYDAGSATAAATDVIAVADTAHYLSNGTSWFRVTKP